ncbi:MAG: DNA repair protein RecN [Bacteroidales bacterium]|nr:DNA repair protein RecN [Bacteroidales bacterium]
MLSQLHIENYALIRHSVIDFTDGFVAITGETGAGKSILLGALSLLLGQRADTKILHDPDKKCIVEASFELKSSNLKELFAENDVDFNDDGSIIIRREILPTAKSRAFVNDTPVAVAFLKELGTHIIDIHSQHANLLLADSGFHIALLDSLGNNKSLLSNYQEAYHRYCGLKQRLEFLTAQEQQNRKDYDYNKFLFDELASANLISGEQEELEQEASLLANAEEIKQNLSQIEAICQTDDDSALSRLNTSKTMLGKLSSLNAQLSTLSDRMESAIIELDDIVSTLNSFNDEVVFSPERQQQVDERLDLIYRLQKKHGVETVDALLDIEHQLDGKLNQIDAGDREIHEVMEAVDKAYKELQRHGDMLSAARKDAATSLSKRILPLLADLGMANATLTAQVEQASDFSLTGCDKVTLLFNANKGGQPRDLTKVASGGEMSRLMLAIKALTAQSALLPTIIFDEIDTGISGDVSVKVGRIMQRMASTMQVIAITHLPQIAARANQHFKVYKADDEGLTASNIKALGNEERRHEIAVMLSAEPPSDAALQTASELMNL